MIFILFLVILSILFFFIKKYTRVKNKAKNIKSSITSLKEKEFNPDISTDNWDLHKLRLDKFKRSQYKGLTFFINSENRIYYLSEEGDKIYC